MLAVNFREEEKYGCPNCGCDRWRRDTSYMGNQPAGTCRSCGLHYQIFADGITESSVGFGTGRKDESGEDVMEYPKLISHPRRGIPKWKYETPDVRPEYGEYWSPRGLGYDLSGFVKSRQAGNRLLQLVKEVLNNENPSSWLDYREREPEWIQFKFQKEEFDLSKLEKMVLENNKIINKEILLSCAICQ